MIKKHFKVIFFLITTLLISSKVVSQSSVKTVEKLIEVTKIDSDFNQINTVLASKIEEKKSLIKTEEEYIKFSNVLKRNFNTEKAKVYLKDYLIKTEKESNLIKIIKLYDNPLMIKMNNYEQDFYNPENKESQITFFKNLKTNPPNQDRIKLLINLNKAINGTAKTKNLLENIIFTISKSYNSILPKEKQNADNVLKEKIKSELPENLQQQISNQFVAIGLYTYRFASDNDLEEYTKIWETELGVNYIDTSFKAYEFVFNEISSDLIINLNKTF